MQVIRRAVSATLAPGGPGNNPTKGNRYTSPVPSRVRPVIDALHDPMTVTFIRQLRAAGG